MRETKKVILSARFTDPKLSLAVSPRGRHVAALNMIKPLIFAALVAALTLSTGCLFSKKTGRTKESSAIATEVEESFRRRWLDKRVGELTAQGIAAEAARAQADQEFRDRYGFNQRKK